MAVRVIVNLPDEVVHAFNLLAERRGCTRTEVIRDALFNEYYLEERVREGCKILLEEPHGLTRQLIFRWHLDNKQQTT